MWTDEEVNTLIFQTMNNLYGETHKVTREDFDEQSAADPEGTAIMIAVIKNILNTVAPK